MRLDGIGLDDLFQWFGASKLLGVKKNRVSSARLWWKAGDVSEDDAVVR